jgi:hypothetical protein
VVIYAANSGIRVPVCANSIWGRREIVVHSIEVNIYRRTLPGTVLTVVAACLWLWPVVHKISTLARCVHHANVKTYRESVSLAVIFTNHPNRQTIVKAICRC